MELAATTVLTAARNLFAAAVLTSLFLATKLPLVFPAATLDAEADLDNAAGNRGTATVGAGAAIGRSHVLSPVT